MNIVNFEGLGLSLNVKREIIEIGGFKIYWYAVCIVLGMLIALLLCKKDDGKYKISFEEILKLAVIVLPVSIICARIYFVLFNLSYYNSNPLEIFNLREGGLAIYGGIIGAIITIILYYKFDKEKILNLLDYIAPFIPLAQSIGRWGNFFNKEAYGTETSFILRMGIYNEYGKYVQVHPTFLYESICTLAIFIFLFIIRKKRKFTGQIAFLYLMLYGIVRAIIESFRVDSLMLGNIRVSQMLSIILVIISMIYLIINYIKTRKDKTNEK